MNTEGFEKVTTDGKLLKKITIKGTEGTQPSKDMEVEVHYVGTLNDGTVFDSSRKKNKTFKFKLGCGQVIKGWDYGVATMNKGEVAIFSIDPDYAYGKKGIGPIPPNASLNFEVELINFI